MHASEDCVQLSWGGFSQRFACIAARVSRTKLQPDWETLASGSPLGAPVGALLMLPGCVAGQAGPGRHPRAGLAPRFHASQLHAQPAGPLQRDGALRASGWPTAAKDGHSDEVQHGGDAAGAAHAWRLRPAPTTAQ